MPRKELCPDVYAVGSIDWDRRLFDELIPLPDGTSYNSYLIKGNARTALIDTVDPTKTHELLANLVSLDVKKIDYIVSHHGEQDHSGSLPDVLEAFPGSKVVTNEKCKSFLIDLLHIPQDRFLVVGEGDTLDLGGKTLEFIMAPWVHWPETFFSYLREERILFPCDFLGSHIAQSDIFVSDECRTLEAAKRYFAEIMMPFRNHIAKHLDRIEPLDIRWIAPSHGAVYQNPALIIDAYRQWISDEVANRVLVPFVSMHGSTRRMVDYFVDALIGRGISVIPFNITSSDIGELAKELVDAATVILASPTVLGGAHPEIVRAAYLANALRPKFRYAGIIGSYGWGGRMVENLQSMFTAVKAEFLPVVIAKGLPREADFRALDQLADTIRDKHRGIGIL